MGMREGQALDPATLHVSPCCVGQRVWIEADSGSGFTDDGSCLSIPVPLVYFRQFHLHLRVAEFF